MSHEWAIAEKANVTKKDAEAALNAALEAIQKAIAKGKRVTLMEFGTLGVRDRQAREGRNSPTEKPLRIPITKVPAFSAGKPFKEKVSS